MRTLAAAALSLVVVIGCKGKGNKTQDHERDKGSNGERAGTATDASPATPPPDAAASPTAPIDGGADDESRAGKKTGLGGADEAPEVITEALITAIAGGAFDAARLIDPSVSAYLLVSLPGAGERRVPDRRETRCGARAAALLTDYAKTLVRRQEDGADPNPDYADYVIRCDNAFLHEDTPGDDPYRSLPGTHPYAVCSASSAGEYASNYELFFSTGATGAVRFAGVLEWESGANPEKAYAAMARDIASPRPCK